MQAVNISEKHMIAASQNIKERDYWLRKLSPTPDKTIIPYDFQPTGLGDRRYDSINFVFPGELCAAVLRVSNKSDIRLFVLLATGVVLLLNKYTGSKDIIVGIPIYRQEAAGEFINTVLPLRTFVEEQWTAREILLQCGQAMREAAENQNFPIEVLLHLLHFHFSPQDDFSLFDVSLLLRNVHEEKHINHIHTNISFFFNRKENLIQGRLLYNTLLYDKQTAAVFVSRLERLLANFLSQLDSPIVNVEMVSEAEKRQILEDFNAPDVDFPKGKTIHRLFREQAEKNPHIIAVVEHSRNPANPTKKQSLARSARGLVLTYSELNRETEQLARLLIGKGVKSGTIAAIMVERSIHMIVAIFTIIKAGAAYLPLSPSYPESRKISIMEDSSAKVLMTTRSFCEEVEKLRSLEVETIFIESIYPIRPVGDAQVRLETNEGEHATCNLQPAASPAYIIYTSGSTGIPKGVMIEHHSVINRLNWMQKNYPLSFRDVILQKTPVTFDVSVWELFWWSFHGAGLCLLEPGGEKDPAVIIDAVAKHQVTTMHFVPSILNVFLEYLEQETAPVPLASLKQVFASGEALKSEQVEKFHSLFTLPFGTRLINLYGPTEATVDVSYFACSGHDKLERIPIGKPIDNIRLYVLGKTMNLQPPGVPGELCITGVGLARGYLNRPELTAEKFVENPYVHSSTCQGALFEKTAPWTPAKTFDETPSDQLVYHTGDLARWLPDGNIEFLGRIDHQVKIRGFRIELGEIEIRLLKHKDIKEVVVLSRGNETNDKHLCAYIVPYKEIRVSVLMEFLQKQLPDYMVPDHFVFLEQIPLTPNGKINKKYLREFEIRTAGIRAYIAPRNEVESKLAIIWKDLLKVEEVGINDNFFDLGGHSLRAMMLTSKIQKEFGAKISQAKLFQLSTIRELSAYIREEKQEQYLSIMLTEKKDYYQLSLAQKRLFFIHMLDEDSTAYDIVNVIFLQGNLNKEKFSTTFIKLIRRHESLRTSFVVLRGEPVQKIHDEVEFRVKYYPYRERWRENILKKDFFRPFELNRAPLLRVGLIKKDSDEYILIISMHHIISDGFSIGIMVRDFLSLYRGIEPVKPRIQYKDFSEWQEAFLKTGEFKKQEDYWLNALKAEIPVLNMPTDYPRPAVRDVDSGDFIVFGLDQVLCRTINEVVRKTNTTLFILLLAAYNVLLYKYTGQEDIIVGTAVTGRSKPDLQEVIGCFMNMLALRNKPGKDITFREFLEEVKENSLKAYENQDYPYDQLVKKLGLQGNTSRNLLFDTEFAMGNIDIPALEIPGLKISMDRDLSKFAKFDLHFLAAEMDNVINIQLRYSTEIFKRQTVEKIKQNYIEVLEQLVGDIDISIEDIRLAHDLLPSKSNIKEQLHGDFRL